MTYISNMLRSLGTYPVDLSLLSCRLNKTVDFTTLNWKFIVSTSSRLQSKFHPRKSIQNVTFCPINFFILKIKCLIPAYRSVWRLLTYPFSRFVLYSEFEAGYLDATDLTSSILSGVSSVYSPFAKAMARRGKMKTQFMVLVPMRVWSTILETWLKVRFYSLDLCT